ncbi:hypothetical protein [Actinokineospora xionganensis]|uniref:DUF2867 domain-containing protein n=1 Tax=Actinokineospora xionganensis TaxID=2684470 RepID=A0ABR7L443_9PSEU|nr:hypothetical protein [Actinokineospora xionganensis]MBC6447451.1 hypothetical protein [Actinokineospora xionganensis]
MTTTLLDEMLPRWQFDERHELSVPGGAGLLDAVEQVTWSEVPLFRGLLFVASLGRTRMPPDRPFLTDLTSGGFTVLGRDATEVVIGSVVRMARPAGAVELGDAPAEAADRFRAAVGPGHYKVAFNFRLSGATVRTETRVLTTDEDTRRKFTRYWLLIRLPSGLIRAEWLRAARRRAKRGSS